jgi:phosphoglucomutase
MNEQLLAKIRDGLNKYFSEMISKGILTREEAEKINIRTYNNIVEWLENIYFPDEIKEGIMKAVNEDRWNDLVYAFWQEVTFGTGGIRGRVALAEYELFELASKGIHAPILKGPNTINDLVFTKITTGVANYMKKRGLQKVVIGYDNRIRGKDYAELIAKIFLSKGFTVYLFNEASPFPELSFAVTYLGADIGIEISASHNDKRYNGYKIVTRTGASLNLRERNEIISEIYGNENLWYQEALFKDADITNFIGSNKNKLIFLGGDHPEQKRNNHPFINMHREYLNHIKKFISNYEVVKEYADKVKVGYCAYYGSGYKLVPWLLRELGFTNLKIISEMNILNGLFPAFKLTQPPDPGLISSAKIAVEKFKEEYGEEAFRELDILIGTDPDADRMGVIVNIPEEHRQTCGDWKLLPADDVWTLLLWYRLTMEAKRNNMVIPDANKKFIVKNHVTTEALRRVAKKFGIDCIDTWVGFSFLAEKIIEEWGKGRINVGAFESSNGFTIGGAKPAYGQPLGENGHTLEKDGTLASIIVAEITAFAKSQDLTILDLLNNIYLDPEIGCFVTFQTALPEEGVFEGFEGELLKRRIISKVEKIADALNNDKLKDFQLADFTVNFTEKFATGKYDSIYWPGFPDEGIRFHFDSSGHNHITIRPSGTEAKIRFYVQLEITGITKHNVWEKKVQGERLADKIAREMINYIVTRDI